MKAKLFKRAAALSMTAVMAMSLCACGAQPSVDVPISAEEVTPEPTQDETSEVSAIPNISEEV